MGYLGREPPCSSLTARLDLLELHLHVGLVLEAPKSSKTIRTLKWYLAYGIGYKLIGIWYIVHGIWYMACRSYGICYLIYQDPTNHCFWNLPSFRSLSQNVGS